MIVIMELPVQESMNLNWYGIPPDLYVVNTTITNNNAAAGSNGGGIDNNGNMILQNSVVAGNTASGVGPDYCDDNGTLTINQTLIGNTSGSNITGSSGTGNILNPANAGLGTFGNNGGPTQTVPLLTGSPAIGAGGVVNQTSAAIANGTTTSISVATAGVFASSSLPTLSSGSYFTIQIDAEQMAVTGVTVNGDGTATLTVTRGANATTAVSHASGASVFLVSDQRGYLASYSPTAIVNMGAFQGGMVAGPALAFTTQPSNATIGGSLGLVTVSDMNGNTPVAGATITISLSPNPQYLNGTTTAVTNASGLATFSTLSVSTAGTYTLSASATGATGATSSQFVISGPTLTTLVFTTPPQE